MSNFDASDVLNDYNPFSNTTAPHGSRPDAAATASPVAAAAPPAPAAPTAPVEKAALPGHDENLRRQEELERRIEALRREEERREETNVRRNNWPPLPKCCPVKPCFFHDISIDIPVEFQNTVRFIYCLWIAYVVTLVLNVAVSVAYLCIGTSAGGGSLTQLGLSILQFVLFTPCSLVCWYRPLYRAARSDSSFSFMVFFIALFVQIIFVGLQALGFSGFGTCGWILTLDEFKYSTPMAITSLVVSCAFTIVGVLMLCALIKVHRLYRRTGASVAKAREEFTHAVVNDPTVQQTVARGAVAAASSSAAAVRDEIAATANRRY